MLTRDDTKGLVTMVTGEILLLIKSMAYSIYYLEMK